MNQQTICILTGGTSGIGRATALALLSKNVKVYELSRRQEGLPGTVHIPADVTDEGSLLAAVETVLKQEGRIDLVINNAGFGISGAMEFTSVEAAQRQFDVLLFGMMRLNRAVIPVMRQQGGGRIVNLSSVAAVAPIPFQTCYSAAKAAVNGYTMALANELRPFGIQVCCVQPGDIATGFTAARQKNLEGDELYGGAISRSVSKMERDEQKGMSAQRAGRYVARVATRRRCKPIATIGLSYKAIHVLIKLLPASAVNRLIRALYT